MKTLEEYLKIDYPIRIEHIIEKDNKYYLAWLPAFGKSTCSATGNTEEEAISNLKQVKETVIQYYIENGRQIPKQDEEWVSEYKFSINLQELFTLFKWEKEQEKKSGEIPLLTYIFTPTGIGNNIKVVNKITGEYIDITDYSC